MAPACMARGCSMQPHVILSDRCASPVRAIALCRCQQLAAGPTESVLLACRAECAQLSEGNRNGNGSGDGGRCGCGWQTPPQFPYRTFSTTVQVASALRVPCTSHHMCLGGT